MWHIEDFLVNIFLSAKANTVLTSVSDLSRIEMNKYQKIIANVMHAWR